MKIGKINAYLNITDDRLKTKNIKPDVGIFATILPGEKKALVTVLPSEKEYLPMEEKLEKVTEITGYRPEYYFRTEFDALKEIIDAIKGIDIKTDKNYKICETYYPAGMNHMNGKNTMLLFNKKCSTEKEQLKIRESVLEGFLHKALKGPSLFYDYKKIYEVIKHSSETNVTSELIKKTAGQKIKKEGEWKIIRQYIFSSDKAEERQQAKDKIKYFGK